jgi:hypothetical protein
MACSSLRASSRRTTRRCPAPSLPLPASVPDTWSLQPRQRVVYQGTTLNCGESLQRARTGRRGMRRRAPPKRDVGRRFVGSTLVRASAGDIQRKKRTVSHTHITSQPTVSMSDRATHRHGGFTAGTNGCALALDREPAGSRRRELLLPVRPPALTRVGFLGSPWAVRPMIARNKKRSALHSTPIALQTGYGVTVLRCYRAK